MEYMGNKEFWDNKFADRNDTLMKPEKSLLENISYFKKGSVLDIACGDGRNTLFLLDKGFKVTGVDFSCKALERLKIFAGKKNYIVETKQIDLSLTNSLRDIGLFDNVLINHYRLSREQLEDMENHITKDGLLFVCGFGHDHETSSGIRKEDLIQPEDFENIQKSFEPINYLETTEDRGFFVTYIFRRKS